MNSNVIEQLLNESESAYLDFKREQYQFDGADDDVKSELLKDILAFTNAWRRTDAYILIGVQEIRGGRSEILGITKHLEDHSLQQFVNSKTQQPITFSYFPLTLEEKQVGVIRIPVQTRPIYLKKDFGKLKKNVVYIRRGSSTDEASPDEIAKMGAADAGNFNIVEVDIEFAELSSHALLGKAIVLKNQALKLAMNKIPDFVEEQSISSLMNIGFSNKANKKYYRELVNYFDEKALLRPVGFAVKNLGQSTIHNVRMTISLQNEPNLRIFLADNLSDQPKKYSNYLTMETVSNIPILRKSNLSLDVYNEKKVINIEYGNLQPKVIAWADEALFIGIRDKQTLNLVGQIYADELPNPISFDLSIQFETEQLDLSLNDLEGFWEKEIKDLLDKLDD